MKKNIIFGLLATLVLAGCAGGTTDPRKGGLFSYNPAAYEQRIAERENNLSNIQQDTAVQNDKNKKLKNRYYSEKKKLESEK